MAEPIPDLAAISPLIDVLVDAQDPALRDRVLIEAVLATGAAEAAALWRAVEGSPDGERWQAVLARGPAELLPSPSQVRGVADGALGSELPEGREVRVVAHGPRARALALGGVSGPEAGDLFEALLLTGLIVDHASDARGARTHPVPSLPLLESLAPALPSNPYLSVGSDPHVRHDLRNLLTSIRATRDLLSQFGHELTREENGRFQDVLEREFVRAGDLLLDALRGGGKQSGEPDPATAGARVGRVVREAVEAETPAMRAAGIRLGLTVEAGCEDAAVALDESALARVLANLLVNARQALSGWKGGGSSVRVGVLHDGADVLITVEDDGPGIPSEACRRVFEEGFTLGKPSGSGYGLSAVKSLVESAGGRVRCDPDLVGGARFELWIPPVERA